MLTFLVSLASAADVDLGVGIRSTPSVWYAGHYGVRATGRVMLSEHLGLEAGVYGRLPGRKLSGLTQTMVGIAYEGDNYTTFIVPAELELGSIDLLAIVSPWERPHAGKLTLWAAGAVGATGCLLSHAVAGVNPEYVAGSYAGDPAVLDPDRVSLSATVGPSVGLTFEASVANRVVVRLLGLQRYWVGQEPDYGEKLSSGEPVDLDRQLYTSGIVEIDVMVHL